MGGNLAFQSSYRVAADFSSASNLVAGDDVPVSGVTVGRVASVQPIQGGARIQLQMMPRYAPVYQDARAMVKIKNVLDESYVELFRGTSTSGPLPEGGTIPQSRTLTPVELAQVLDRRQRSEEHTSELQSHLNLVCRLLLEKKKNTT